MCYTSDITEHPSEIFASPVGLRLKDHSVSSHPAAAAYLTPYRVLFVEQVGTLNYEKGKRHVVYATSLQK